MQSGMLTASTTGSAWPHAAIEEATRARVTQRSSRLTIAKVALPTGAPDAADRFVGMARRARWLAGGVLAFLIALVISGVGGCNIHELGHLITGVAAGIPVNEVIWCAPANGRIAFAYQEPALVGYAGGVLSALVLTGLYWSIIRPRLGSFGWWMAGVAVMGTAISQVIVAILEGSSPVRYAELQDSALGLVVIAVGPLVAVASIQFRWRRPAAPGRESA